MGSMRFHRSTLNLNKLIILNFIVYFLVSKFGESSDRLLVIHALNSMRTVKFNCSSESKHLFNSKHFLPDAFSLIMVLIMTITVFTFYYSSFSLSNMVPRSKPYGPMSFSRPCLHTKKKFTWIFLLHSFAFLSPFKGCDANNHCK